MKVLVLALLIATGSALAGCSSGSSNSASPASGGAPTFSQVPDLPVPDGARMDVNRTLLLGQGPTWVGRLVYTVRWTSPATLYDYFKTQMVSFGWQEVTSVRGEISLQTWQKASRICSIQIDSTTLGSEAIITMSPATGASGDAGGSSQSSSYQPPAPAMAPMPPAVTSQPLK